MVERWTAKPEVPWSHFFLHKKFDASIANFRYYIKNSIFLNANSMLHIPKCTIQRRSFENNSISTSEFKVNYCLEVHNARTSSQHRVSRYKMLENIKYFWIIMLKNETQKTATWNVVRVFHKLSQYKKAHIADFVSAVALEMNQTNEVCKLEL